MNVLPDGQIRHNALCQAGLPGCGLPYGHVHRSDWYMLFRTLHAAKAARNRQNKCLLILMEKDEHHVTIHEAFS